MDRARLILPILLAVAGLALVLPGLDRHGLWFDEAYTARLAALDWPRLVAGAQRDIHPPGWPLVTGLTMRLPLSPEWALRLPAAVCFAALAALVGVRNVWAGVAILLYGPLVEQAGQGRPYVPLALGLVAVVGLGEERRWRWAGVVLAGVASLHALGGVLGAATVLAVAASRRPRWQDLAWLLAPSLTLCAWWLPKFAETALTYVRAPWYPSSSAADWWIVSDAGGAAVALLLLVFAAVRDRTLWALAPAAAVAAVLAAIDLVGIGAELRKTGIVVLPLLLVGSSTTRLGRIAVLASVGALGATSVRLPDRPDLREAQQAVSALGSHIPVISVFASEAAWYLRSPAPLPSFREPSAIAGRIRDVVIGGRSECVIAISLPDTFPAPRDLPAGARTILVAEVTGLDVRLVGTTGCNAHAPAGQWRQPDEL